jgi:two-component system phosphate regulon response regulator PhoB
MSNILVVENDHDHLRLLEYVMIREGFSVRTDTDGAAALSTGNSETPDLVLLDWMLPSRSGIDVCEELRRRPAFATVPIVMISARATEPDVQRAFAAGATDYITKPFTIAQILSRVRAALATGSSPRPHPANDPQDVAPADTEVDVPSRRGHQR